MICEILVRTCGSRNYLFEGHHFPGSKLFCRLVDCSAFARYLLTQVIEPHYPNRRFLPVGTARLGTAETSGICPLGIVGARVIGAAMPLDSRPFRWAGIWALLGLALRLPLPASATPASVADPACPGCAPDFLFFDNTANLTATAKGNFVVDVGV